MWQHQWKKLKTYVAAIFSFFITPFCVLRAENSCVLKGLRTFDRNKRCDRTVSRTELLHRLVPVQISRDRTEVSGRFDIGHTELFQSHAGLRVTWRGISANIETVLHL